VVFGLFLDLGLTHVVWKDSHDERLDDKSILADRSRNGLFILLHDPSSITSYIGILKQVHYCVLSLAVLSVHDASHNRI
jgi:hypothetical protein